MTLLGITSDVARPLCWALLHFLWQGLALTLLLSVALSLARCAATRYLLALAVLVLMVAAPVATILVLRHSSSGPVTIIEEREPLRPSAPAAVASTVDFNADANQHRSGPSLPARAEAWLLEFWLAGVVLLSLRGIGGLCWLERVRRRESVAVSAEVAVTARALERRVGLRRAIRYCQCRYLEAPAVIGWVRPVVLLPVTALTGLSAEQLEAVIVHELAHIRRHDAFVNLFQIAAETLLFYHPAVWWVSAQIRSEREHCCDDVAVGLCGGIPSYARALMLMEEWRRAPQMAVAANGSPLRARVMRLMALELPASGARSMSFAAALLCLTFALLAGTGLLGAAASHTILKTRATRAKLQASLAVEPRGLDPAPPHPQPSPAPVEAPSAEPQEAAPPAEKESYIAGLRSVGLKDLTADQLISLKVQGVTPEYVRQIHAAGLNPTVDELIGMRVQGVTPEYIRAMAAHGFKPTINDLIGMKVQGVTPDYLDEMHGVGVDLTPESAIGMRVQGVTADYVRALRAEGFNPKPDQLIGLRVQGVTPEYVRLIHADGLKPNVDELIGMQVQDVTAEYVGAMHDAGLTPTIDQLIGLKVQDVTPEYVRALQASGLGNLSVNDFIAAKVIDITPEFIAKVKSHGVQGLTLNKVIELKRADVYQ
jgi:beta-lactamase regulating signal transducer with metallopeptidase domain